MNLALALEAPPKKFPLRSDQTEACRLLFRNTSASLYVAIWRRRNGNYAIRLLTQEELIEFLRNVQHDGFGKFIKIFRADLDLYATVVRGKVRVKTRWRWF